MFSYSGLIENSGLQTSHEQLKTESGKENYLKKSVHTSGGTKTKLWSH